MSIVNLERFSVKKINYINNLNKDEQKVELYHTINSNVKYNKDESKCVCILSLKILPSDTDADFCVEIEVAGLFSYEEGERKDIHVEACNKLYPYLQTTTISVMTIIGIPNFILPEFKVNSEDVVTDN